MAQCCNRLAGDVCRGRLLCYAGAMSGQPPPSRLFPLIVLAAIVLVLVLAWWLFPVVQAWIANQDCVALGRTNCSG